MSKENEKTPQTQKKATAQQGKNHTKLVVIIAVIIIAVLVAVIVALVMRKNTSSARKKRPVVVTESNAEDVANDLIKDKTPTGYYETRMNANWTFPNGKSKSTNAYVENADTNTNDVYFDVIRSDNNETIYSSPIIPIGKHIEKFKLDKNLSAGTYNCVCRYHLVDDDQNTVSTLNVSVTVTVEG